ncbi:two-component system regulatory protein YycI [Sedimentibacter sp. B4]|uniref:two-component system regulatory protein YycI n=1 Tax=Sedimentibacter sp. B4 TaxID=304766 RepID=UPI0005941C23|nr:two-component system regulatory protein YycI [Sedimentibacter sp. B4]
MKNGNEKDEYMDWNKSNTILIIAFVILNIILLASYFNNAHTEDYNVMNDEQFVESVEELLKQKNITVNCEISEQTYVMPILDTEYEMIDINNEIIQNYLGSGVEAVEDVYVYNNDNGETLEIINGKKLSYTIREKIQGKHPTEDEMSVLINDFVEEKNISMEGYTENRTYVAEDSCVYSFTQSYNDYSMENSYMNFYADENGIYKFEMQRINQVKEITEKVRTVTAVEALMRLLTYDDVSDKEIIKIEMTYYSMEDENWQYIARINSDPAWKVIFSDGTQKHLPNAD